MNKREMNKDMDNGKHSRRKRRKKGKIIKRILLVILLIIIAVVGWFIYKTQRNGGGLKGMIATVVGHDENTRKNLTEIKFLALGISTDQLGVELTDTIMVVSYNPNTQKANILSIPRDTYTGSNPSKATASQKINALQNIYEDPAKTLEAVNDITGLDIEHYVIVRTEALIELVDAIGGVEFNVPIDMNYHDPSQDLVIELEAGMQHLDGDKAEQLLRFRHNDNGTSYPPEYGDNDFGRMRTQREFIVSTLKQTLKPSNIFKIGQILDIANKNIETTENFFEYAKDYIPYAVELNTDDITTASIPGSTPNWETTNNVSIFVVDKAKTAELVQSMFFPEDDEEETENGATNEIANEVVDETVEEEEEDITIELLNATGDPDIFEKAKQLLEDKGYTIKRTGKVKTIMASTEITNKKDVSNQSLRKIRDVLGVGNITTNKMYSNTDISIIIGTDFKYEENENKENK